MTEHPQEERLVNDSVLLGGHACLLECRGIRPSSFAPAMVRGIFDARCWRAAGVLGCVSTTYIQRDMFAFTARPNVRQQAASRLRPNFLWGQILVAQKFGQKIAQTIFH